MSQGPFELSGRIVMVTGAGQGLGAAIAEIMALHGAHTVLLDIDFDAVSTVAAQIATASSTGAA